MARATKAISPGDGQHRGRAWRASCLGLESSLSSGAAISGRPQTLGTDWGGTAIGTLYVVGTPIGNLEDVSPRAQRVLAAVQLIAAEDTRRTRKLLSALDIHTPLVSFHAHSSARRLQQLIGQLASIDIALVSDAGTPGVSDPGARLVAAALEAGHRVVAVPGPSAVATALSVSGLPADAYVFVGYLPRQPPDRRQLLAELARETRTIVAFETPHRLRAALADLAAALGGARTVVIARELTKLHEEVWRGSLAEAGELYRKRQPRGEFTLVIAGSSPAPAERWAAEAVREALAEVRDRGCPPRQAARAVAAEAGWPVREVYRLLDHPAAAASLTEARNGD